MAFTRLISGTRPRVPSSLTTINRAGWYSFVHRNTFYPRFSAALCALLLCLAVPGRASDLPTAPRASQHVFAATDWSLAAGVISGRAGDWMSTQQMLRRGYQEEILPTGLAHSKVGLGVFEASAASLQVFSQWELTRHGHRKMARTIAAVNVGASFAVDAHNLSLPAGRAQ